MAKALWWEFMVEMDDSFLPKFNKCGLCDNSGMVDLKVVNARTGRVYTDQRPCICPNGRAIKREMNRREKKEMEKIDLNITKEQFNEAVKAQGAELAETFKTMKKMGLDKIFGDEFELPDGSMDELIKGFEEQAEKGIEAELPKRK